MKEESNVRRHVLNAFKDGELERDNNNVHFLHFNGVKKPVPFLRTEGIGPIVTHIRNAYNEGELEKESTCKEYLQVQTEGKRRVKRIQKYYDLDVTPQAGRRR